MLFMDVLPLLALQFLFWDVIHPQSRLRASWDLFILLLVLYVCLVVPYV
jgi:hypothetical protein